VNAVVTQVEATATEIRLVHALGPFPVALEEQSGSKGLPDFVNARQRLREQAKEYLARTAEKLRSAGFETTYVLEEGDARQIILDCAEHWAAELIVVGSHGR